MTFHMVWQTVIEKLASAVSQGVLSDCNSREAQELQMQAMRKVFLPFSRMY